MNWIFKNKDVKLITKLAWPTLVLSGLVGIVLMWIARFYEPITSVTNFHRIGLGANADRSLMWKEQIMVVFYFTHVSSLFAIILGTVIILDLFSDNFKRGLKIMGISNLVITIFLFWSTLAMKTFTHSITPSLFGWVSNSFLHIITPTFGIGVFIIDTFVENNNKKTKFTWKTGWKYTIVPAIWLVLSIILYLSIGMDRVAAVYTFIDLIGFKWYYSLLVIVAVIAIYYGIVNLLMFLMNVKTRKKVSVK